MAIAGRAHSGAWTFLIAVAIVLAIVFDDGSVRATDVKLGDCIETTPSDMSTVKRLPKVSCDTPHEGEIYALLPVSGSTFPRQETWDQGDRRVACLTITEDKRTGSVKV